MPPSVDPATLRALRLQSQRIAPGGAPSSVPQTVRGLLAIQAQDFAQAVWAIGLRTPGSVRSDVMAALTSGEVIRSAPMRGTLHFLAAADLRWILGLTSARTLAGARTRFRELGLDETTFERAAQVARVELAGGGAAGREEFLALVREAGISTEGQRGYHIIFNLSQRCLVCWGPPAANQQALVLVDEWITQSTEFDRPEALREFVVRYFAGHGPATLADFAWWTKLTLADARAGLELARDQLTEYVLAGQSYWATSGRDGTVPEPDATPATQEHAATREHATALEHAATREHAAAQRAALRHVYALPGFDEFLLGYQDRSLVLDEQHVQQVVPGKNGIFRPVLVSGGAVTGTWRRADVAGETSIRGEPFASLTSRETTALRRTQTEYRRFMAG
ncbi:winged helix DNA-binding protein [Glaciihabitans tibetensis]|uniref:Winged helix DNA-binding protein n=1 Tax=Glaciihabitans tibetensis TaxID=1266600 RepID=A0A2T0VIE8_9MICO|nr:winged helix DNA-binding domain-containing protein [Glaciihabitans tibetensis]PRY70009.1 winged helix DNA-binding protein [Glaciihabitans tibetensis]